MKYWSILFRLLLLLGGCSQKEYREKPAELYATKEECTPHSPVKECRKSRCMEGRGNVKGETGIEVLCAESWEGWVPIQGFNFLREADYSSQD